MADEMSDRRKSAPSDGEAPDIRVRVNGEDREVPASITVKDLLERLELVPAMVVVEHNREILDRRSYDEVALEEGDQLELVHFVGGG